MLTLTPLTFQGVLWGYTARYGDGPEYASLCPIFAAWMALERAVTR